VFGIDAWTDTVAVHRRIAYVSSEAVRVAAGRPSWFLGSRYLRPYAAEPQCSPVNRC
jgi:hypothetical protein